MPQQKMFDLMGNIYHGNQKLGIPSQCDQIVGGLQPFSSMFEIRNDIVAGTDAVIANHIILKAEYSRIENPIVLGRDVTTVGLYLKKQRSEQTAK